MFLFCFIIDTASQLNSIMIEYGSLFCTSVPPPLDPSINRFSFIVRIFISLIHVPAHTLISIVNDLLGIVSIIGILCSAKARMPINSTCHLANRMINMSVCIGVSLLPGLALNNIIVLLNLVLLLSCTGRSSRINNMLWVHSLSLNTNQGERNDGGDRGEWRVGREGSGWRDRSVLVVPN